MSLACVIHAAQDLRLQDETPRELGPHDVMLKLGAGGMGVATARIAGREHTVVLCDIRADRLAAAAAVLAEEGIAAMFVTHPPLAERVRRLRQLDPEWRAKQEAA